MKKKAIILIMIVFVLMSITMPVFADIPIPAIPMDAWEYWAVVEYSVRGKTYFKLVTSHNPITAPTAGGQLQMNTYREYVLDGSVWKYEMEHDGGVSVPIDKVYAASHNIAYRNSSGFFFTVPKASTLYLTMKRVDSGMILKTISHGLIPLVGLLLSVTCFRKAWAFLRNQLTI